MIWHFSVFLFTGYFVSSWTGILSAHRPYFTHCCIHKKCQHLIHSRHSKKILLNGWTKCQSINRSLWLENGVCWPKWMACPSQGNQDWWRNQTTRQWQWASDGKAGCNSSEGRNTGQAETIAPNTSHLSQSHAKPCKSVWKGRSEIDGIDFKAVVYILPRAHSQTPPGKSCPFHRQTHNPKVCKRKFITALIQRAPSPGPRNPCPSVRDTARGKWEAFCAKAGVERGALNQTTVLWTGKGEVERIISQKVTFWLREWMDSTICSVQESSQQWISLS